MLVPNAHNAAIFILQIISFVSCVRSEKSLRSSVFFFPLCSVLWIIQSRPIEMRATILYLAYCWTEFEMLLTPLRFLYLVMFSLLAFPSISQFIAHFWQFGSFLCIVLPFSNSYRNESCSKACSAHYANAATLFFWRNKMEEQKRTSNPRIRGIEGI